MSELLIGQAISEAQLSMVRELLREYIPWALSLSGESPNAPTFQGIDDEIADLPGPYAAPQGQLLLATLEGCAAGCVGLKGHNADLAELKRLYVRPNMRGRKIGLKLVERLIEAARAQGYSRIILDSHVSMEPAHSVYRSAGFRDVPAPEDFPDFLLPVVVFMALNLT